MVAVVCDNAVKIPVDLTGKTGNISLPAWAAIQKELLSGANDRKLLACRILSGDLKHHPESVETVLSSASILNGLAEAVTCGDNQVEREVCSIVRICCYEADLRAGEAVAASPPLLNGLCRLALKEDPFVVETLSQLSHNNPKVLWLITTLLKVLRVQLKRDLKLVQRFFLSFRTEVELLKTKRKILEATKGAHDLPAPGIASLAYHVDEPIDIDKPNDKDPRDENETVAVLCDVEEWMMPVKAATMREFKLRETQSALENDVTAMPVRAHTVRELKPRESLSSRPAHPWLSPGLTAAYRAASPQRMVDVDEDFVMKRICDVQEYLPARAAPMRSVTPGRQTMCDVDVVEMRPARSATPGRQIMRDVGPAPEGRQTMVDVDIETTKPAVDYRMWQTGRSTVGDAGLAGSAKALRESRSLSPRRWTRVTAPESSGASDATSPRQKKVVEVIPWHKSQRWVMAAMARSTAASTVRLTNHSSHQGVYRPREYTTVQEQRQTLGGASICDVEEYLPASYRTLSTVETTRARTTADGDLYSTVSQVDRPKMPDSEMAQVRQSTIDAVLAQPPRLEPSTASDASVLQLPLSVASSTESVPQPPPSAGRICDVAEYLAREAAPRPPPRKTFSDWSGVLDTTKPSMPIYSTMDEAVSSSIGLYTTNPGQHPEPSSASVRDLSAFPSDWSEAMAIRSLAGDADDEHAWF